MVADRGHAAAGEVDLVEFDVGDRAIFGGDRGAIARRDGGDAPAAALDLGDAALRGGIARIDDVKVVVGAVALGRAEADELAVEAPRAARIAALAARGELREAAVGERVELEEFVAAIVLADEQDVARRGQAAAKRFGLEADLAAVHHRPCDAMELADIAEARRDEHRAVGGVPPGEARAARFHVGARGGGERVRDRGNAVGGERRGLGDIGERGRGGGAGEERGEQQTGHAILPPDWTAPILAKAEGAGKPPLVEIYGNLSSAGATSFIDAATASARRSARRKLPPASLARLASLQPRRMSSANSKG